ncbi:hypothetical protein [Algirhabdus cladophorae]|uniref:hypothetical protein n=1 Tax=Algirhabdus cladophorae TaxID=3377108 RepID=UPI003B84768F
MLTFVAAQPAAALVDCDALKRLVSLVQEDQFQSATTVEGATFCQTSKDPSGVAVFHCGWGYDYRSPGAEAAFSDLLFNVEACWPSVTATPQRAPVNHPDSFDQRLYDLNRAQISVSLKDKARLAETYVFIAVQRVAKQN